MRAAWSGALVLVAACDAASPALGRDAALQVLGAQWRPGPEPESASGPTVDDVGLLRATFRRDGDGQRIVGTLAPSATAVWIGLEGDIGGWSVTAGPPGVDAPTQPAFAVEAAVTAAAAPGPHRLRFMAIDGAGQPGRVRGELIVAEDEPAPAGELVVSLVWDGAADLDLHVVAPDGGEAWSGDPNTWEPPPPGTPVDPNAWRAGGLLTRDGNAGCRRDPRPREDVVWSVPPPSGRYVVRVDARAMCGAPVAYYYVTVRRGEQIAAAAAGVATPDDTLLPHGAGAGVTVADVELP